MHFHQANCLVFLKLQNISHWKIVSVKFCRYLKELSFCGRWAKNIQTFTRHFFDFQKFVLSSISNYCINVVCLVLSWSRRYSIKRSSNFDNISFNNSWPLYLSFSNITNLCLNTWIMKNWKCQQFLFWKKEQP